ncbi:uncharacterized protein LOC107359892 isoform X4 [Tetranychus urticae]|uniref:DUF19 domain-containing protein n=1 Tax=Tetranychus urticae TaxID=32264 RepID=A0A158P4J8_TETUR|nr:uncharacterized protein LOC107359892 isoform X4 [Tetranychus urticae]
MQTIAFGFILFVTFCLFSVFPTVSTQTHGQSCHLRELDLCAATLLVFTQNPSELTGNDVELDKQCSFIREAEDCRRNFTRRCTTPLQRELIDYLGEGGRQVGQEFCTRGSPLREEYKKHARCLGLSRRESAGCSRDLQRALEVVQNLPWDSRIQTGCCAYNRYDACTSSIISSRCGPQALSLSRQVLRLAASRLPEMLCQSYQASSKKCTEALPASGESPLGSRSNSLLSRLFSTYAV